MRQRGDVVAALRYAQADGLEIAVRCGAHSVSGQRGVDGGWSSTSAACDRSPSTRTRKRARAGGGALIADLDAATQAHGLAVPTGLVGHTGIGGLTLGGGMGWLTRQAGLACDNLESVEIVVADGRVLRASADENADLFWAVRGGGGNFGVVTEFEYRLHEVGPMIQFGFLFWEAERGREALRADPRGRRDPAAVVQRSHRGPERSARAVRPRGAPPQPGFALDARRLRRTGRARAGGRPAARSAAAAVRGGDADAVHGAQPGARRGTRGAVLLRDVLRYAS